MSLLCLDKQVDKVRDKLVEQTILEVDNVGRGDMACDGDWLVMGSETGVAWTKVGAILHFTGTEGNYIDIYINN